MARQSARLQQHAATQRIAEAATPTFRREFLGQNGFRRLFFASLLFSSQQNRKLLQLCFLTLKQAS
jgi:hypothetical protein